MTIAWKEIVLNRFSREMLLSPCCDTWRSITAILPHGPQGIGEAGNLESNSFASGCPCEIWFASIGNHFKVTLLVQPTKLPFPCLDRCWQLCRYNKLEIPHAPADTLIQPVTIRACAMGYLVGRGECDPSPTHAPGSTIRVSTRCPRGFSACEVR